MVVQGEPSTHCLVDHFYVHLVFFPDPPFLGEANPRVCEWQWMRKGTAKRMSGSIRTKRFDKERWDESVEMQTLQSPFPLPNMSVLRHCPSAEPRSLESRVSQTTHIPVSTKSKKKNLKSKEKGTWKIFFEPAFICKNEYKDSNQISESIFFRISYFQFSKDPSTWATLKISLAKNAFSWKQK